MIGDFNFRDIDWSDNSAHSATASTFLDCVSDNYLHQLVTEPTREKYVNDLLLTGNTSVVHDTKVREKFFGSDHKIITAKLDLFTPPIANSHRQVFQYSHGKYTYFQAEVDQMDWQSILSSASVHQNWETFKDRYFLLVQNYIPSKTFKPGNYIKVPWTRDRELLKAKRKKRLAEIEYARCNLHVHKIASDKAKAIYQCKILEAKARYESRLARGILQNPKLFQLCEEFF